MNVKLIKCLLKEQQDVSFLSVVGSFEPVLVSGVSLCGLGCRPIKVCGLVRVCVSV